MAGSPRPLPLAWAEVPPRAGRAPHGMAGMAPHGMAGMAPHGMAGMAPDGCITAVLCGKHSAVR